MFPILNCLPVSDAYPVSLCSILLLKLLSKQVLICILMVSGINLITVQYFKIYMHVTVKACKINLFTLLERVVFFCKSDFY